MLRGGPRTAGKRLDIANAVTLEPGGGRYLGTKPQLAGQVVVPDLLGELDAEVPRGAVLRDAHVHDLVNDVQHGVLEQNGARAVATLVTAVTRLCPPDRGPSPDDPDGPSRARNSRRLLPRALLPTLARLPTFTWSA